MLTALAIATLLLVLCGLAGGYYVARRLSRRLHLLADQITERADGLSGRLRAVERSTADVRQRQRQQGQAMRDGLRASREGLDRNRQAVASLENTLTQGMGKIFATTKAVQRQLAPPPPPPRTGADMVTAAESALGDLVFDGAGPSVVLVLNGFSPSNVFAGVRTTVLAAAELARQTRLGLRVIVIEPTGGSRADGLAALRAILTDAGHGDLGEALSLSIPEDRDDHGHHPGDVWLATFWTTAWGIQQLVRRGRVSPRRVVYLVQDWEPGFYPWGDLYARARQTYDAGFRLVVNSLPLATYVGDQLGRPVSPAAAFAPAVDTAPLGAAADAWTPDPDGRLRVLFYARPSKPRNMFNLGLQALRRWGDAWEGPTPVVYLAGEASGSVDLGDGVEVVELGKTSYDDYYALLSRTDVGLALMNSPHPGHLALELPMVGIPTVTNAFGRYREPWVEGLVLAEADPASLAAALDEAAATALATTVHRPRGLALPLGGSLEAAITAAVGELDLVSSDAPADPSR